MKTLLITTGVLVPGPLQQEDLATRFLNLLRCAGEEEHAAEAKFTLWRHLQQADTEAKLSFWKLWLQINEDIRKTLYEAKLSFCCLQKTNEA